MDVPHCLSRRRFIAGGAACSATAIALPAWSAGPPRTIRLVVAHPAGDPGCGCGAVGANGASAHRPEFHR